MSVLPKWLIPELLKCSSSSLYAGDTSHDPQWIPETKDTAEPNILLFSYHNIPIIKLVYKLGTVRDEQQLLIIK